VGGHRQLQHGQPQQQHLPQQQQQPPQQQQHALHVQCVWPPCLAEGQAAEVAVLVAPLGPVRWRLVVYCGQLVLSDVTGQCAAGEACIRCAGCLLPGARGGEGAWGRGGGGCSSSRRFL
jgi:hypothetical protein